MSGDSKELKFNPEKSILGELRGRLDKLEDRMNPQRIIRDESGKILAMVRKEDGFIARIDKLEEKLNNASKIMSHADVKKVNLAFREHEERIDKLDGKIASLEYFKAEFFCNWPNYKHKWFDAVLDRLEKLESSIGSKTQEAVIGYYNDDYGGDYDCKETRSRLDKFLFWLDKNDYEIRGKG